MVSNLWSDREQAAWRPKPPYNVAQWAGKRLYFSSGTGTAMPGFYRVDQTPYAKEPLLCWSLRDVQKITLCWGTQLGKTTVILVCIGHGIDHDPGTMMLVMTSQDVSNDTMRQRIWPLIRGCKVLRSKFPPEHKWKTSRMDFDGGFIRTAGANSSGNLASFPFRYLFLDETAKYPADLSGEGDAQASAEERQKAQPLRKTLTTSTPVQEGDNILNDLKNSLRRDRYVPCPHCGAFQLLIFERVKWPHRDSCTELGAADYETIKKNTWYECQACKQKIEERHKRWMETNGRWVSDGLTIELVSGTDVAFSSLIQAAADGDGFLEGGQRFDVTLPAGPRCFYRVVGETRFSSHIGYHLNSLHSLFFTWGEAAVQFLKARHDPGRLQVFINSVLAEPWKQTTDSVDTSAMVEHIDRDLPIRVIPEGYDFLFCGADYHGVKIGVRFVLLAVRHDFAYTVIDYGQLGTLTDLGHVISAVYPRRSDGLLLTPDFTLVDSGWETQEVYDFCKTQINCLPCKGAGSVPYSIRDLTDKDRPGGKSVVTGQLFSLAPNIWKDHVLAAMKWRWMDKTAPPPANYIRLHRECGEDLIAAFGSEKRIVKKDKAGRETADWVPVHHSHIHYWDAFIYAVAAAHYRIPHIQAQVRRMQEQQQTVIPAPPSGPNAWKARRF